MSPRTQLVQLLPDPTTFLDIGWVAGDLNGLPTHSFPPLHPRGVDQCLPDGL